jgi:hypothetical protein
VRNEHFSIHIDEASDCSATSHLIAYMRYAEDITINKDMFFYKPIKRTRAKELFKIVDERKNA